MRTAVDTNVFSAIWDREPTAEKLVNLLGRCFRDGSVVICGAVFAETLAHPRASEEFIRGFFSEVSISIDFQTNEELWSEAGRRYGIYAERRRRSAPRPSKRLLADFIVGSHALLESDRFLTLDRERYQRDFPELVLLG